MVRRACGGDAWWGMVYLLTETLALRIVNRYVKGRETETVNLDHGDG